MLSVGNLQYSVGKKQILRGITAIFSGKKFHVIVGPNGSGKSTFLKIFSGAIKPSEGNVYYDEKNIAGIEKTSLARMRAVMSQQPELSFPLLVEDIVMMGRYPYFSFKPSQQDEKICREAMEKMELQELASRDYLTLSGGEKQRVQFARVLAQIGETGHGPKYLFLDEAISHLDLKHQHQLLRLAKNLCSNDVTVIAILHDLNLAINYADRIMMLKEGSIAYDVSSTEQLTGSMISEVFDVRARLATIEGEERKMVIF
jgi:iron complex transport system ATP-binding protein